MLEVMRYFIAGVLAAVLLAGCSDTPKKVEKREFVRLYMHRPGEFSCMVQNSKVVSVVDINVYTSGRATLFTDVPENEPCYFVREGDKIEIHIHNVKEVNGGAFKPGKAAEVKTTPIE